MSAIPEPTESAEDLIPTRRSLLGRLKDWRDNESWEDFFNTYWKLIYAFAIKRGLTHQEAEETVQEIFIAIWRSARSRRELKAKS